LWSDGRLLRLKSKDNNTQELAITVNPPGGGWEPVAFVSTRRDLPATINPQLLTREQSFSGRQPLYLRQPDPERLVTRVSNWRAQGRRFQEMLSKVLDFDFRYYAD